MGYKIVSCVNDSENRFVNIKFNEGPDGKYSYVWLRDNTTDPHTFLINCAMKARKHQYRDFDFDPQPLKVEITGDGEALHIVWPPNLDSTYTAEWLYVRNLGNPQVIKNRRKVYLGVDQTRSWDNEEITKSLKTFKHNDVMNDDKVLHDFLYAVVVDGIAVVKDGPGGDTNMVRKWEKRIGMIQKSHYGKIFEVAAKPDASNMADVTGEEIQYHVDLSSSARVPELQLLHVVQAAEENGGMNIFCDGFKIAELLRKERPDIFEILTTVEFEYITGGFDASRNQAKKRYDYELVTQHPVFRLNKEGQVVEAIISQSARSWYFEVEPEKVPKVYEALQVLMEYCYKPENLLKTKLETGDTVLWGNTRVFHARTEYKTIPGSPRRLLNGCYFNWDYVKSKIREIRGKLQLPENNIYF
uniref:Gamma-butyrobetaine dioxygenase n=1 Tax=Acrobeloides nanus TaxID=290746 RepID=A0A914EBM1_9BILA